MYGQELIVEGSQLVLAMSRCFEAVDAAMVRHHVETAYIAGQIGNLLGVSKQEQRDLCFAGLLHDIGAFSLHERRALLRYDSNERHDHTEIGYRLLKQIDFLANAAQIIRYHHLPWEKEPFTTASLPLHQIIHLADRISVLRRLCGDKSAGRLRVQEVLEGDAGSRFMPEAVAAFLELSAKEYFWLDIEHVDYSYFEKEMLMEAPIYLDIRQLTNCSATIAKIIDFKSPFTACHSIGVAVTAEQLAACMGFSAGEAEWMRVAGHLHDLGKMTIPSEILNKREGLTAAERELIRAHTYFGYRIMAQVDGLSMVNAWASFHHERLDGKGYPFSLAANQLSLGSRVMAVADVFTALREDRPYRAGMDMDKTLNTLQAMVQEHALDDSVLRRLAEGAEVIDQLRAAAQAEYREEYDELQQAGLRGE